MSDKRKSDRIKRLSTCGAYNSTDRQCWHLDRISTLCHKVSSLMKRVTHFKQQLSFRTVQVQNQRRTLHEMNLKVVAYKAKITALEDAVQNIEAIN